MSGEPSAHHPVRHDPADGTAGDGLSTAAVDSLHDAPIGTPRTSLWRRLRRVAAVLTVLLVAGVALVVGLTFWAANPSESVQLVNGRMIGDTSGYVAAVDQERRTVAISRSVFGWRPVVFTVSPHTVITVQNREGALGDLASDMLVHVTYEIARDGRMAHSIEIGGARAEPSASGGPRPGSGPPSGESPQLERPVSSSPRLERQASPSAPMAPPAPATPAPRAAPPAGRLTPQSSGSTPSTAPGTRSGRRPPRDPRDGTPDPGRPRESADSDPADGSAAIEWLIDQAQRR